MTGGDLLAFVICAAFPVWACCQLAFVLNHRDMRGRKEQRQ